MKNPAINGQAQGSFLLAEDQALLVPARKVEAVDTTAAGDAF
ncbi:PfkB family carbohydrate kinase, partial [candidate division KSB1 bacterium]